MGKKKIYYAHPMSLYGTPQEERDVALLKALGFEVVNPNSEPHIKRSKGYPGMSYWRELVRKCDALAFRAFPGGSISAGVGDEIAYALGTGRGVIELPSFVPRRVLSIDDTIAMFKELGQR